MSKYDMLKKKSIASGKEYRMSAPVNPERQKIKAFCEKHGITRKQYRKLGKAALRSLSRGEYGVNFPREYVDSEKICW